MSASVDVRFLISPNAAKLVPIKPGLPPIDDSFASGIPTLPTQSI